MTKDEIVEELKRRLTVRDVTQAVTHPAFDAFVGEMQDRFDVAVVDAWYFFREGWASVWKVPRDQ